MFWRDTLIDAAVFREWVVNVGRRDAYARIAHVLCEIYVRLRAIGLVNGQAFEMPITQAELGDATGLSTVHVNRTLQELRGNGLITTPKSGRVVIEDWDGLQEAGEFELDLPAPQEAGRVTIGTAGRCLSLNVAEQPVGTLAVPNL